MNENDITVEFRGGPRSGGSVITTAPASDYWVDARDLYQGDVYKLREETPGLWVYEFYGEITLPVESGKPT
jgi:hypothetical protein